MISALAEKYSLKVGFDETMQKASTRFHDEEGGEKNGEGEGPKLSHKNVPMCVQGGALLAGRAGASLNVPYGWLC